MGYCPAVPEDIRHYCCASCASGAHEISGRDSRKRSRDRGTGERCDTHWWGAGIDDQCASGACRDWGDFDKRCCPHGHGNRWDQCGNLPPGARCKNWDGSQCQYGECVDPPTALRARCANSEGDFQIPSLTLSEPCAVHDSARKCNEDVYCSWRLDASGGQCRALNPY